MTKLYIYIDIRDREWYRPPGVRINVSRPKDIICNGKSTGFRCYLHSFTSRGAYTLMLFNGFVASNQRHMHWISKIDGVGFKGVVYVYFYEKDPRPLLFCYEGNAYTPKGKDKSFQWWVKDDTVSMCDCTGENELLLKSLVKVVGFLNTVDLSKYPPGTGGNSCISGTNSVAPGTPSTCTSTKNVDGCTYVVDKYKVKSVKIKVTCAAVKDKKSDNGSCYKKLTHTPAGINGEGSGYSGPSANNGANGFRLGDVVYNNGSEKGSIKYYENGPTSNGGENWWKPLVSVSAYFYDADKEYKDPLLVELQFKNNGGSNDKECYKLTCRDTGNMSWEKDPDAESKVEKNGNGLVKHLDCIRYGLKKVLKVEIASQKEYAVQLSNQPGGAKNGFSKLNSGRGQVKVEVCKEGVCQQLTKSNYKCYRHKLTNLGPECLYKIGGLAFTIPGVGNPIEIDLYEEGDSEEIEDLCEPIQLTYNTCMGDVFVYFYSKGTDDVDKVPLMLHFNGKWYKPESREEYFTTWVTVSGLGGVTKPCGDGKLITLVNKLNEVNRALNQIDLDKSSTAGSAGQGAGASSYGLPGEGGGGIKPSDSFPTMRVSLKKQEGPKPPAAAANYAYTRIVHRTVNGFEIGEIKYNSKDFADSGVNINGTSEAIKVKNAVKSNGNHTALVSSKGWNTVVVYYSIGDTTYQLPQLIVILKTDKEVVSVSTPVTGSANTAYGYYILSEKSGSSATNGGTGVNYEYKWVPVTNGPGKQTTVTLDDATDFSLLNSVVLLLDKKCNGGNYDETKIKQAIKTAGLKSPGQTDEINRITGKTISVSDATESTCLKETGFKVFTHDISQLVTLDGKLKTALPAVSLITGLKFLIPTFIKDSYTQLKVFESGTSGTTNGKEIFLYHQPNGDNNKIRVYFYQGIDVVEDKGDPRPLMFCYNSVIYGAKDMNDYDSQKWTKDGTVKKCVCATSETEDCNKLLAALVKVSNFLNPLNIKYVPRRNYNCANYYVHKFNGQEIRMKVEKTRYANNSFCYHRYTHTHFGIDCNGEGFRLGNIKYEKKCIKENGTKGPSNGTCITSVLENGKPYTAASKVVVFYYKYDKNHETPLIVILCGSDEKNCKTYYILTDKANKKYKKKTDVLNLSDNNKLGEELDKALFSSGKKLQIIIDKRPVVQLYKPDDKDTTECNESDDTGIEKTLKERRKRDYDVMNYRNKPPTYHLPTKTCYKAKFIENGQPASSGTKDTNIVVKEQRCKELELHGYRCYEQDLLGVTDIGGLKFSLWPDQGKELCLYKVCPSGESKGTSDGCANVDDKAAGNSCTNSEPANSNCGDPGTKLSLVTTSYTTCKGNVYVYFYGDDPRPLMLCYGGNAYGPRCVEEYACRWVCLASVPTCDSICTDADQAKKVLCHLYKTSMFLNPVKLGHTKCAYQEEKRQKNGDKKCANGGNGAGQSTQNQNGGSNNTSKAPYSYEVHKYPPQCIRVSVTAIDLSCYRQYVHKPEKEGFRLGQVSYEETSTGDEANGCKKGEGASANCPTKPSGATNGCTTTTTQTGTQPFCFNYTTSKQLIGVGLYYYMYDCCHDYPLIVELQFKGEVSEYYRLSCTGGNKKWVKMVDPCCNQNSAGQAVTCDNQGGNSCKDQSVGSSCKDATKTCPTTDNDTCELDAEFARRAREIEQQILGLHMANQVDQVDFMALTAELIALVEGRAYRIRKALVPDKDWQKENLIMATDKNCHEDSMLMYVLGGGAMGGAVGVAGGGGWKAMVFMLGMFVKL